MEAASHHVSLRETTDQLRAAMHEVKPHLRGWLHLGTFPVALAAGIVLVCLAHTAEMRIAGAVFGLASSILFGCSALYHRGTWTPTTAAVLRRLDHSNIFLMIAGTYTPFAVGLLGRRDMLIILTLVWGGALTGIVFRVFWLSAPRWLYLPIYVALGWAAVFWIGDFARAGGAAVVTLIAAGGGLYSLGALAYGLKWPNPSPRWFGFHEIFHSFTIAAYACHYVGVSIVTYALT